MRVPLTRSLDLVGAGVVACAAVGIAFAPSVPTAVRVLLGLPLVLVLPGYAFTAAAWPSLGRWGTDKIALTLGSSISLAILGGLLLNFTPWGLERRSWAVLLAGVTLVAAAVALAERERLAHAPRRLQIRPRPAPLLLFTLALLVAVAALGISRRGAIQVNSQSEFTQLWLLPMPGKRILQLGVANREGSPQRYRIVVRAGQRRLAMFGAIRLEPGRRWERRVRLPGDLPSHTRIEADLYRAPKQTAVYRHVTFWSP